MLAALVFAQDDSTQTVEQPWLALAGFVCFCLMSSVVYLFNDIQDQEYDRLHPIKKARPIASGSLGVKNAYQLLAALLVALALCKFHRSI